MHEYLKKFLENNNIDIRGKKVTIGVSTGVDSMSLLFALLKLKEEYSFDILVCHINHNKRLSSVEEEKFIIDYCKDNNISCFVKSIKFNDSKNFQEEARNKRYEFFYEVMEKEGSNILFLAHHANDLAETIIMRLIRGTSLNGYSGFHEVSSFGNFQIVRPLTKISKIELYNYQKREGFKYFEDESNLSDDYTRNKIRHQIVPLLIDLEPKALEKIYDFSKDIDSSSNIVMEVVHQCIKEFVSFDDGISFKVSELKKYDPFIQKEIVFELLKGYRLSEKNIDEIFKWIYSNKANFECDYKNIHFLKEYDLITITKIIENKKGNEYREIVIDKVGEYFVNDNIFVNVLFKSQSSNANKNELCYNTKKLPIIIRSRKDGDKIKLANGYKKVKDLLIDEKVSLSKRKKILIAQDFDNNILCVFGVRKSDLLKQEKYDIKNSDIIIRIEER